LKRGRESTNPKNGGEKLGNRSNIQDETDFDESLDIRDRNIEDDDDFIEEGGQNFHGDINSR